MMRFSVRALLALSLVACGGSRPPPATSTTQQTPSTPDPEPAPPVTAAPESRVRLIHAAVESSEQQVALVSDGASTPPTTYQFASTYIALAPGHHEVSARANDAELIGAAFELAEGLYTVVAYSTGDFPVALALASDSASTPPSEMAQIRAFHAIVGQGAIDLCTPPAMPRGDGTAILANIAAGSASAADGGYVSVPGGTELLFQLRAQHATPCHGRVLGTAHGFTPAVGGNYTLVFVGRTSGRHRVAPELLFCADPPAVDTSCATLSIDPH